MPQDEEGFQSTKGDVQIFLDELKSILNSKDCILDLQKRDDKEEQYSNRYCMNKLDYFEDDVKLELKSLEICNYYRTVQDENIKKHKEYFYVFGKIIKNKMVYIKVKIVSRDNKNILCMSFHFPKFEMTRFPYR